MNPRTPHSLNSLRTLRSSRTPGVSRRRRTGLLIAGAVLLLPVLVSTGGDAVRATLDFGAGVLSLVSLTASVVWGLVASDRVFLTSRQRLLAQAVHRITAVSSLVFLLLHISVKLALSHVTPLGALIPFSGGFNGSAGLIGLGVTAGLLMVTTGVTGALRSSMASPARLATRWRATHMLAYPAWCFALMHGLYSGRPAKAYVTVLYCLALVAVAGAVALRASPQVVRRKVAVRILEFLDAGPRASGTRRAGAPLPQPPQPRTEPAPPPPQPPFEPAPPTQSDIGFAAAYRAVSALPRSELPTQSVPYLQQYAEPMAAAPTERWPAPSPPPPAPAPPSLYDPTYDTPYGGVPGYPASYGDGTNSGAYEDLYRAAPDYKEAPDPTEPLPGPYQAPASGEPWTTPYGGTQ
ncbi:cytochrome b/b6 domain-containing protein [Streptomyces endophyticus]|uniref:Cytochrome b/b6 domain-containing protein n=1 Tax=Streptomyces endophyticus TaxID=714166 RepID=A0ABU6F0Y5_9ACTN|nr:cytochrome b/b6 domain-containing protein [Streptomyces endophyticus]MEB8337095.1 cytochrome b/b6 domain-containing protein [Streptomyces endophyticus]